ncbi:MAG: glycosyltransferase family 4 protein [Limnochordia bacterium]|jgi:1,2-diacylglycerol 3-alpha-glucosyltransferase
MRIGIFADSYEPYVSGVVRSIKTFTKELIDLGHQIYIFAPSYSQQKNQEPRVVEETQEGVTVFRYFSLPVPTYPGFVLPLPISFRTNQLVRKLKIDIVHSHSPFLMGQLAAMVARRHKLPLVFTHHTLYPEYAHYVPVAQPLVRRLTIRFLSDYCRKCDLVIAPSPSLEAWLKSTYELEKPTAVIPTGILLENYAQGDPTWLRRAYNIPEETPILLFVGRISKEKNVTFLLDMLPYVKAPTVLICVGSGPLQEQMEARAQEMGLGDRLIFTGLLEHHKVIDACLGADIFVFPSVTETQGIVLAEAMAGHTPVVAVESPATSDILTDGKEGFLTPAEPEIFAQRVNSLLEDPNLLQEMGQRAAEKATQYSSHQMALRLVSSYQMLLEQRQLQKAHQA